jgi:RNase P/RNase MRP subunit p29
LKRVFLAAVATLACVAVPASAVARGHEPGAKHARQHAREHHKGFGLRSETPGVAGRIVSHTGNAVAIRTLDGSVDTGMVTDATKVFCIRHTSLAIVPCVPGDIRPGRRIAGALLAITPHGNVWKLIVVWD